MASDKVKTLKKASRVWSACDYLRIPTLGLKWKLFGLKTLLLPNVVSVTHLRATLALVYVSMLSPTFSCSMMYKGILQFGAPGFPLRETLDMSTPNLHLI
jgi:hypothetical protein